MSSENSDILTVQRAHYVNWCNNHSFSSLLVNSKNMETIATPITNERSFSLAPELLMEIFSYLNNNQTTMHSVSLVCKQWFFCAAPILYCHPQINDTYRWATFLLTMTREHMSFFYGDLIRSIDLSSGKSIEAMKDQEFYRRSSDANGNQQQQPSQRRTIDDRIAAMAGPHRFPIASTRNSRNTERRREEHEYVAKGLPYIIVSTSSLIQVSNTCKNLTVLNLSCTNLLHDSVIAETGEYVSTLQRYAVQPGLTHVQIPIEDAIEAIGKSCSQLEDVKIQRCEWATAHVIWMFAYYCPNLKKLDARRSTKCTVKKLIASVLELSSYHNTSTHLYHGSGSRSNFIPTTLSRSMRRNGVSSEEEDEDEEDDQDIDNIVPQENEEPEAQDGDTPVLHFWFNDETGLWERELRHRVPSVIEDNNNTEDIRNGTFRVVPLPITEVEDGSHPVGRRPPSPIQHHLSSQPIPVADNRSLKDIIRTVIVEYKDLGGIDLNWIQNYQ